MSVFYACDGKHDVGRFPIEFIDVDNNWRHHARTPTVPRVDDGVTLNSTTYVVLSVLNLYWLDKNTGVYGEYVARVFVRKLSQDEAKRYFVPPAMYSV